MWVWIVMVILSGICLVIMAVLNVASQQDDDRIELTNEERLRSDADKKRKACDS